MLCSPCEDIFSEPRKLTFGTYYPWRKTQSSFEAGRLAGCHICRLVYDNSSYSGSTPSFSQEELNIRYAFKVLNPDWAEYGAGPKWLAPQIEGMYEAEEVSAYNTALEGNPSIKSLAGLLKQGSEGLLKDTMEFWLVMDFHCPGQRITLPLEVMSNHKNEKIAQLHLERQTSTGSPENFDLATSWLNECMASHPECRPVVSENSWLPSRLLQVGTSACPTLRIVKSSDLAGNERNLRYAALSHCWGGVKHTSLTRNNITKYEEEIPPTSLSRTISDAVEITRGIGLRYLWIDSLCILQDSKKDWDRESATMLKVYGLSTCTIVAAHAKSGSGGCFNDRDQFRVRPCKIPNPFNKDSNLSFCLRSQYLGEIYKREVKQSSWYKRGWVFQERLLSPRLLMFGQSQMLWACQKRQASETWPCGKTNANFIDTFDGFEVEKSRLLSLCDKNRPVSKDDKLWWSFILDYTRSETTEASDRVIALQGIASRIQSATGKHYVAGMWIDESLPASLLWSVTYQDVNRPAPYRAPSWSWASVDGPIDFTLKQTAIHATMVKVLKASSTSDPGHESRNRSHAELLLSGYILSRIFENTRLVTQVPLEMELADQTNQTIRKCSLMARVLEQARYWCVCIARCFSGSLLTCSKIMQATWMLFSDNVLTFINLLCTPITFITLLAWYSCVGPCIKSIHDLLLALMNRIRYLFGYGPMTEPNRWQNDTLFMQGPAEKDYDMHAEWKFDTQMDEAQTVQVLCLPVLERAKVEGLLLARADEPGQYRRLGTFRCNNEHLGELGTRKTFVLV